MAQRVTRKSDKKTVARAYYRYLESRMYSLWDAYNSFSRAKEEAYEDCLRMEDEYNGRGLKVIGACTTNFSVGFIFRDDEEGVENFMYITKDYDRYAPVSELEEFYGEV